MTAGSAFPLDPSLRITQYVHDLWTVEDGLPQNSVEAMTMSGDGYFWLGTQEGLVRFDGVRFETFDKSNLSHFTHNWIVDMCLDGNNNLLVATLGGDLVRRHAQTGEFSLLSDLRNSEDSIVKVICPDAQNRLWIGTSGGLKIIRLSDGSGVEVPEVGPLSKANIHALYRDGRRDMWVGTYSEGLFHLSNGELKHYDSRNGLLSDKVTAVMEDQHGSIWIGSLGGLHRLDRETGTFQVFTTADGLPANWIADVFQDRDSNIWIATTMGLCRLNPKTGVFSTLSEADGLAVNAIISIFEDPEGNLWFGGSGGGLNRLQTGNVVPVSVKEGLSNDMVRTIYQDREGDVWIGTGGGGLNRLHNGKITVYNTTHGLNDNIVRSLYQDQTGALWVGTASGLNRLDPETGKITSHNIESNPSNSHIRVITGDRSNHIWLGGEMGLLRLTPASGAVKRYSKSDGLTSDYIQSMHADRRGNLWIGTYGGGLNRMAPNGAITVWSNKDGLRARFVLSIYEDEDDTMWFGTKSGIARLKDGVFNHFDTRDGLFDDTIFSIREDRRGNLWMSCNKGIFRVSKRELELFWNGSQFKPRYVSYGRRDGMKSRECNGGSQPVSCSTNDGKLWFSTIKGAVVIDPESIKTNSVPPPVVIEKIVADEREILPPFGRNDGRTIIPPGNDRFEIHFTGLSFFRPGAVGFKYKLDGYDRQWISGYDRVAHYTRLPHGYYTFHVKARNNDMLWNTTGASVSFYIPAQFYQTTWFYILCGFVLALGGYGAGRFHHWYVERRAGDAESAAHGATRTRQLTAAKEAAENADKAKSRFIANLSHEIRTPLNAILGFADIMTEETDNPQHAKYLASIATAGRTLLTIINDLLDISRMEAGTMQLQYEPVDLRLLCAETCNAFAPAAEEKGIDLQIRIDANLPESLLLDQIRLRQILFNLVGNAVKFTPKGFVRLSAGRIDNGPEIGLAYWNEQNVDIVLQVEDSGVGIPEERKESIFDAFSRAVDAPDVHYDGTGLGLAITQRLVRAMGGEVILKSRVGKGSTFTVILKNIKTSAPPELLGLDGRHAENMNHATHATHANHANHADHMDNAMKMVRFHKAGILVLDDYDLNRRFLKKLLANLTGGENNFTILGAANGKEALELAHIHRIHLLLINIRMNRKEDFDTIKRFKRDPHLQHIPVIAICANIMEDDVPVLERFGCDGLLRKPVEKRDLLRQLMRFLSYRVESTPPQPQRAPDTSMPTGNPEKLPQLLEQLQSAIHPRYDKISKTMLLDEVKTFARDIIAMGREFAAPSLSDWGDRLYRDITAFDMQAVVRTMETFPALMDQFKNAAEKNVAEKIAGEQNKRT